MKKPLMIMRDSLQNMLSGIGVGGRDKGMATRYIVNEWSDEQKIAAFRSDWIARKAINIPAYDSTREWRAWQAENDQIEKLEAAEKKFDLVRKLFNAMSWARLYGGAALVLGIEDGIPNSQPIVMEKINADALKFIHAVPETDLNCGDLITDLMDPFYGYPQYFERKNKAGTVDIPVKIHPSRVIVFKGIERPDSAENNKVWGDSVLIAIDDAVKNAGTVSSSIRQLIDEAKVDVLNIPGLTEITSTPEGQARLTDRLSYANVMKSNINTLVLDEEEKWNRHTVNFAGMPDVLQVYLMIASAAVDIPATRFLSQDPKGLNATGDSDTRNYYDRVKSDQKLLLTPQLAVLDEVLIRSVLGSFDKNIYYEWNPLWQMTLAEKAELAKKKAETVNLDLTMQLIPTSALVKARQNMVIEDGFYPGIEAAIAEAEEAGDLAGALQPEPSEDELGAAAGGGGATQQGGLGAGPGTAGF